MSPARPRVRDEFVPNWQGVQTVHTGPPPNGSMQPRTLPTPAATAEAAIAAASRDLIDRFGRDRLAETAFPVYTSRARAARWLGWSRVRAAERLLADDWGDHALDIGAGLGAMLPFLSARYLEVDGIDLDAELTRFMRDRLRLTNVRVDDRIDPEGTYQLITALDVLEHVEDLARMYDSMLQVTAPGGAWVISGPTENLLYRSLRRISGPGGEGHVRTVYDVLRAVPPSMTRQRTIRLPFGSPVPLFLVALFRQEPGVQQPC